MAAPVIPTSNTCVLTSGFPTQTTARKLEAAVINRSRLDELDSPTDGVSGKFVDRCCIIRLRLFSACWANGASGSDPKMELDCLRSVVFTCVTKNKLAVSDTRRDEYGSAAANTGAGGVCELPGKKGAPMGKFSDASAFNPVGAAITSAQIPSCGGCSTTPMALVPSYRDTNTVELTEVKLVINASKLTV